MSWLLLIFFLGFAGRLYTSLDPMLHPWDERYHALVAKHLIDHPLEPKLYVDPPFEQSYQNWTQSELWLHKQPVPLWTMAASMSIFGVEPWAMRLPSLMMSSVCILLTFSIARILTKSDRAGLIAATLHAVNGLVIELAAGRTATDHVDTFFLFFIEVSILLILLAQKRHHYLFLFLAGIFCGLAILTKWLPALICLLLLAILEKLSPTTWKRVLPGLILVGTVALVVALPWQIFAWIRFPEEYLWEQAFNSRHFTEGLEGHGQPWWYFFDRIRITVHEGVYFFVAWGIWTWRNSREDRIPLALLLTWIFIPMLVFSLAKTKMQGYLLFSFPAYFVLIGWGLDQGLRAAVKQGNSTPRLMARALFVLVILLAVRYGLERTHPWKSRAAEKAVYTELTSISLPDRSVIFGAPNPIELMFFTDAIAYEFFPTTEQVGRLISEGWNIWVVDQKTLPEHLIGQSQVQVLALPASIKWFQ